MHENGEDVANDTGDDAELDAEVALAAPLKPEHGRPASAPAKRVEEAAKVEALKRATAEERTSVVAIVAREDGGPPKASVRPRPASASVRRASVTSASAAAPAPAGTAAAAVAAAAAAAGAVGRLKRKDGAQYEGEVREGKADGSGALALPGGSVYCGRFAADARCGAGALRGADGSRHEGTWAMDRRTGPGVCVYPDGSRYAGGWAADGRSGFGRLETGAGEGYEGEWGGDAMTGAGCSWRAGAVEGRGLLLGAAGRIVRVEAAPPRAPASASRFGAVRPLPIEDERGLAQLVKLLEGPEAAALKGDLAAAYARLQISATGEEDGDGRALLLARRAQARAREAAEAAEAAAAAARAAAAEAEGRHAPSFARPPPPPPPPARPPRRRSRALPLLPPPPRPRRRDGRRAGTRRIMGPAPAPFLARLQEDIRRRSDPARLASAAPPQAGKEERWRDGDDEKLIGALKAAGGAVGSYAALEALLGGRFTGREIAARLALYASFLRRAFRARPDFANALHMQRLEEHAARVGFAKSADRFMRRLEEDLAKRRAASPSPPPRLPQPLPPRPARPSSAAAESERLKAYLKQPAHERLFYQPAGPAERRPPDTAFERGELAECTFAPALSKRSQELARTRKMAPFGRRMEEDLEWRERRRRKWSRMDRSQFWRVYERAAQVA
eukprot:tig00020927_g15942.t1